MPRKPTGRPRGRPVGTGTLGAQTRLTVSIPTDLYNRLITFVEGRPFPHGTPELATSVREALEHFLACPHKRQTIIATIPTEDNLRQTKKNLPIVAAHKDGLATTPAPPDQTEDFTCFFCGSPESWQDGAGSWCVECYPPRTRKRSAPLDAQDVADVEAMLLDPEEAPLDASAYDGMTTAGEAVQDTPQAVPPFDSKLFRLGALCKAGHGHGTTGLSLRRYVQGDCMRCVEAKKARKPVRAGV